MKINKQKKSNKSALCWLLPSIAVLTIAIVYSLFIGFSANQPGWTFNKGNNAVWIGHEWVGETKSIEEVQELVDKLSSHDFKTVYVHSGPLNPEGKIKDQTYEYAADFLEKARKLNSDIQYQSWLGQIRSKIDLSKAKVRQNIANTSFTLTEVVGFDGIHFDIEPVWDEDLDFIKTLEEVRDKLPSERKISVALAEFIPKAFIWLVKDIREFKNYNSEVNYKNVAKFADQLVVMTYDTGINKDWAYRWLVQEQTIWLTRLLKDKEVFVGIPAYEDVKPGFNPEVENVENGVLGIIDGLNNSRSHYDSFSGIAIYSYWTMDEEEFTMYRKHWLKD